MKSFATKKFLEILVLGLLVGAPSGGGGLAAASGEAQAVGPPSRGPSQASLARPAPKALVGLGWRRPARKGPAPALLYKRSTSKAQTSLLARVLQGKLALRWFYCDFNKILY